MSVFDPVVPEVMRQGYDQLHFSPGAQTGDRLYCSGQLGLGPDGRVPEDAETQFAYAFENLGRILEEAGLGFADIVDVTTFHVGLQAHIQSFRTVKDRFIPPPYPAWTAIGISELAIPGALFEVKATALIR